jgi:hypothetical protein
VPEVAVKPLGLPEDVGAEGQIGKFTKAIKIAFIARLLVLSRQAFKQPSRP